MCNADKTLVLPNHFKSCFSENAIRILEGIVVDSKARCCNSVKGKFSKQIFGFNGFALGGFFSKELLEIDSALLDVGDHHLELTTCEYGTYNGSNLKNIYL